MPICSSSGELAKCYFYKKSVCYIIRFVCLSCNYKKKANCWEMKIPAISFWGNIIIIDNY